jgi:hypothetical protein
MAKRQCIVNGCDGKHHCRGFCRKHYKRWKRHGDPLGGGKYRPQKGQPLKWLKIMVANPPENCVIWPFGKSMGYGIIASGDGPVRVHRLALVLYSGRNPKLFAAHGACHNKLCCNPLHLSWSTGKQNSDDRNRDGTMLHGEMAPNSKLSNDQVLMIFNMNGSNKSIGDLFGVAGATVWSIKTGRTWSRVTGLIHSIE